MARQSTQLNQGWTFRQHQGPSTEWLPVEKVPTQVHVDLLANKKIPDPFVDLNERAVQWIGYKDWEYQVTFTHEEASSQAENATRDLVFSGLDTFATVYLNGDKILEADNMFVSYRVNVTDRIKAGSEENTLRIVFRSAIVRGEELIEEHAGEHNFLVRQTERSRVPVRKAQYNWGWDWGPILMTAGPWKPVALETYVARVDDVWAQSNVSEDLKTVSGFLFARVGGELSPPDDQVSLTLSMDGKTVFQQTVDVASAEDGLVKVPFKLEEPKLWYPRGYGSQSRYQLNAKLHRKASDAGEIDSLVKLIGFRRTELVQEPDAYGKSFYFRINNVDVFAGGSCWIPADSYLANVPPERYREWAKLVAEGNQVMLRVWGGGVYEEDALIDACDELGILVFHDFQFACASYPAYPSYLKTLEVEARQQIRRLRTHPSVVIWAGNNEDYQVQERYKLDYDLENKDPESWLKSSFPARYIYEHFLPKLVEEEDPGKLYHPSSPWGDGKPTADPTVGDIHQWNIWHGTMNKYQEAANMGGRFVSEFGMEAYPHLSTTRRMATDPGQLYPGSMVLDAHNKAIGHERRMMSYVVDNFRPRHDLGGYTHLTQVVQSETMRAAYKAWRRQWGSPGARRCGGALVWQLNDCWPTVSWAVVDYHLVKKPAYYAIARALRRVDVGVCRTVHDWTQTGSWVDENSGLVTGQVDHTLAARKGTFDVWVVSSATEPVELRLVVRFISVRTGKDVVEPIVNPGVVVAAANSTTDVLQGKALPPSVPHPEDLATKPFSLSDYDPYVVHATVADAATGVVIAADTAWPEPIKYLDLSNRGITFEVSPAGDEVVVEAEKPVKGFVFEEVEGLRLSDNGFDVVPGERQVVKVGGALKAGELLWTCVGAEDASLKIGQSPASSLARR
ncbi:glycoside hydrolase family 2 protein [Trichoderma citrinoviride]|uniref:Beta-mannosidase B n=1 Tax=Trichoderma citrinoviride TaxID=58853 RepID=A0A2T4B4M5_9HYPO|nr:glycoside hydrolase family 2 protein [Trichoderma citrinoviride]PTB64284.1 glycoside hydrolase family 2 protein [Trichoderma citrinoviride]